MAISPLTLHLGGHTFSIPKKTVLVNCDFFDFHANLYGNPSYEIDSKAGRADCQTFLDFI
jgi:hypothetical protein